jgi:hypothetical protein
MILANHVVFGKKYAIPADPDLVLHIDASDTKSYNGGSIISDLSNEGNDGNLVNGTYFNSDNGGSLVFDGVNDRVSLSEDVIATGDNFTVNAWIYVSAFNTRNAIIANSMNYSSRIGWLFSLGPLTNSFFFSIGADAAYSFAPANTLNLNEWVFLSVKVHNGGQSIILYKNGTAVSPGGYSLSLGTISYSYNQANIGVRDLYGTTDPFNGRVGFSSVYNTYLSDEEILQIFNDTKTRFGL